MKRLYFLVILSVCSLPVFSQTSNCTQVLRLAQTTYQQGRLHEIPQQIEGCLAGTGTKGFSNEEKREAYRILTLAYIYLEEPDKADEAMLNLLNTDHYFQINKSLDPAEFISLYNKFRTTPLFRLALKFGMNITQPTAQNYYNIGSTAPTHGKYLLNSAFQVYGVFEKDLFKKPSNKWVIAPEVGYVSRKYGYDNDQLATADENPATSVSSQEFLISQSFLDFNGIVHYKLRNTIQTQTYIGAGPGVSYLLSSSNLASTKLGNGFTISGTSIDDGKSYNKLTYSFTAMAGAKLKFGEIYVTGEVRYQYGLVNLVDKSARTNAALAYDYQGQYNDYRISNLMINIGIVYPYFKPKKLIK